MSRYNNTPIFSILIFCAAKRVEDVFVCYCSAVFFFNNLQGTRTKCIFCINKMAYTERKCIREQEYLRINFSKFKFRKGSHCQLVSTDESGSLLIICHVKLTEGMLNSAQLHNEISFVITSRITYFLLKDFCRHNYTSMLFSECRLPLFSSLNSSLLTK